MPKITKRDVLRFLTVMEKTIGRIKFDRIFQSITDYKNGVIDIDESISRIADILAQYPELMENNMRFFPHKMLLRVKEKMGTII